MTAAPVFGQTADELIDDIELAIQDADDELAALDTNSTEQAAAYDEVLTTIASMIDRWRLLTGKRAP